MLSKYVSIGDKLDLETIEGTNDLVSNQQEGRKYYRSQVYDIVSEDQIKIAMPMEQGKIILLPVDGEYNVCFYTQTGLYQCLGRIIDRYKSDNVFVLVMELTTDLRKYQRREYYRLNCVLEMKSREVTEDDVNILNEHVRFLDTDITFNNGVMVDISGGGARFISKVRYPQGANIQFVFSLYVSGALNEYKLIGKVLLSERIENREDEYEHRIQFVNILNDDRESIIRYIFEEERKNRHRQRTNYL
ncbi:MAG: flagellar brake protein [Lachnospiraceae bacterium]|nr:flagellar brake protein [Lachnospiraceae bacterium]MCR4685281.1 flagellar brake protein [Lachnospiraceae bacterium]